MNKPIVKNSRLFEGAVEPPLLRNIVLVLNNLDIYI